MQTEIRVISKIHPTLQQARFSAHQFLQNDMFKNALNMFSNFVTAKMKISIFIIIIFSILGRLPFYMAKNTDWLRRV